jgi:hypothetical protein
MIRDIGLFYNLFYMGDICHDFLEMIQIHLWCRSICFNSFEKNSDLMGFQITNGLE